MIVYLGGHTLGELIPIAVQANAQVGALIGIAQPDLEGKIEGALQVQAALEVGLPDLAGVIAAAQALIAEIENLSGPTVTLQGAAVASLLVELKGMLGGLQVALDFQASLSALMGTGGFHVYAYSGPTDQLGSAFGSALASGLPDGGATAQSYALLIATTSQSSWAKLSLALRAS